jgi:iron(III) transport system ATP-binding protein
MTTSVNAEKIDISGLRKQFKDKVALSDVSLSIEPGSFTVLLGPSGSGKTTLLRCLAGIERPTAGTISLSGREVAGPRTFVGPEKRNLSMVFQDYALWPHMTVRKNIAFPLANSDIERGSREGRVTDLLERVGIAHLADNYPNELSGGEQQRVALARALSSHVGLVLFDEPLSNLDADRRDLLRIEIATLTRESGATAVYITHDQAEAFALADRIGVLNKGELVQWASPEKIYRQPASSFVARFTGVSGEFPVEVASHEGETISVKLPFAQGAMLEATRIEDSHWGVAPHVFVRAAGVSLHTETHDEGIAGSILDHAYTGRGYEHVVEIGEGRFLTKVYSSKRFERGTHVRVVIDPTQCFVMDA